MGHKYPAFGYSNNFSKPLVAIEELSIFIVSQKISVELLNPDLLVISIKNESWVSGKFSGSLSDATRENLLSIIKKLSTSEEKQVALNFTGSSVTDKI